MDSQEKASEFVSLEKVLQQVTVIKLINLISDAQPALSWYKKDPKTGYIDPASDSERCWAANTLSSIAGEATLHHFFEMIADIKSGKSALAKTLQEKDAAERLERAKLEVLPLYGFLSDEIMPLLVKHKTGVHAALALKESLFATIDASNEIKDKQHTQLNTSLVAKGEQAATLQAENDQLRAEITRLRAENDQLRTATISPPSHAAEFDPASPTYPRELDQALKAWRAVSSTEGKGKPKARLRTWLDANDVTKLSNEAKERITVVANWDKSGGATRTD